MIFNVLIVKFITCLNKPKIPNSRIRIIREPNRDPVVRPISSHWP